ncbi:hypothetical protein SELMODRAFT_127954 [Selaginella moellendorffii]|uniref:Uncharacterized protein RHD2L7-2 n=1 Tax=Selaginella moellendorffii TaxID=88036 RepID=D8SYS3_SELML|nr:hypothetical protein SELMODRAFT_127954 [Selaginella moellendorffii]
MPVDFSPDREPPAAAAAAAAAAAPPAIATTSRAIEGLRFIDKSNRDTNWETVDARFRKLSAGRPDGRLARSDFGACIGMKTKEFAGQLFDALSRRRGKEGLTSIGREELSDYWLDMTDKRFDSRMRIFFDLCDKDLDGRIFEDEVKEVILLSASANRLSILEEQAEEYAALIMEELDREKNGYIGLLQLEGLLRSPSACDHQSQMISSSATLPKSAIGRMESLRRRARVVLLDDWQRVWMIALWFAVMAVLFSWKFIQYSYRSGFPVMGYCLCTAKGAAETLKLNMALILLPVCRNTITWLRSTALATIVPFDDNINFHKLVAAAIVIGVFLHGGVHLTCDFYRISSADYIKFIQTLGVNFKFAQPTYLDLVLSIEGMTGIIMVLLMIIAFLLATHWSRRNLVKLHWPFHRLTGFNAFWYSHHLFVLVYGLLIVHSFFLFLARDWREKTAWMYIAIPALLYTGERTLRTLRACTYKVSIVKASIYSGNVLALYMTKPPGFRYQSGMYLFLQCPAVSPFEWHPFSITSAPGDEYVSVHIRSLGDWTQELMKIFSQVSFPGERFQGLSAFLAGCRSAKRAAQLCVDGPYGAPSQDFKKYDILLLVGLGIGATPFISILRDMLNHLKSAEQLPVSILSSFLFSSRSNELTHIIFQGSQSPFSKMFDAARKKAKKNRGPTNAYFYWVTREQSSFEWFKGVMNEVSQLDHKAVIEMHNYLTSVYEEGDARSTLIGLVQALHHARSGVDIVSGTRVRTHFARPNWRKVFARLASIHPGARIGVFYCGNSAAGKELDLLSRSYSEKSNTKFIFHKEKF